MQPSEFWGLAVCDWWAELDLKIVEHRAIKSSMSGSGKGSNFSPSEWAEARQKHKAKRAANG